MTNTERQIDRSGLLHTISVWATIGALAMVSGCGESKKDAPESSQKTVWLNLPQLSESEVNSLQELADTFNSIDAQLRPVLEGCRHEGMLWFSSHEADLECAIASLTESQERLSSALLQERFASVEIASRLGLAHSYLESALGSLSTEEHRNRFWGSSDWKSLGGMDGFELSERAASFSAEAAKEIQTGLAKIEARKQAELAQAQEAKRRASEDNNNAAWLMNPANPASPISPLNPMHPSNPLSPMNPSSWSGGSGK